MFQTHLSIEFECMWVSCVYLSEKCVIANETQEMKENFLQNKVKRFQRTKFPLLEFFTFLVIRETGFLIKGFL